MKKYICTVCGYVYDPAVGVRGYSGRLGMSVVRRRQRHV